MTEKKYKITRKKHDADPYAEKLPNFLRGRVLIAGYREQGWAAFEQPSGRFLTSGNWGDSICLNTGNKWETR